MVTTFPKKRFNIEESKIDPNTLAAGRYGTQEMCEIFGSEKTFEYSLIVQAQAAKTLSRLYPDIVSKEDAIEIENKANLKIINPSRIRELEAKTGHDVIAINTALEEVVNDSAKTQINKGKTSADTTQPARAVQLKKALKVIIDSVENIRDITLEKSMDWIDVPHMDVTHGYDALPTVAGRPLSHYAEMLQFDLELLKYVYKNSTIGKWGDATGNHHSATALGINGIKLQEEYCKELDIGYTIASAQLPGLEFEADIWYALARLSETLNNLARYIEWGRSDDVDIFVNASPVKQKGSSAMPHKDAKNGNPTAEEQFMSIRNYITGNLMTAMENCNMPYARDLAASANSRINFEDGFKTLDHSIRNLANRLYYIEVKKERSIERVERSYGVVTAQLFMTHLTDSRKVKNPLSRSQAHDLMGELATKAWNEKKPFIEIILQNKEVTDRLTKEVILEMADPKKYIGQSKEIVKAVYDKYHEKRTL